MARKSRLAETMKRFWMLLFIGLLSTSTAHADLGFWSAALVGKWHHPRSEASYEFRSNATYVLRGVGLTERGWWKIVQPTAKESGGGMEGPVALRLKSRLGRTRRLVVDVVTDKNNSIDKNRYFIGAARWQRVE